AALLLRHGREEAERVALPDDGLGRDTDDTRPVALVDLADRQRPPDAAEAGGGGVRVARHRLRLARGGVFSDAPDERRTRQRGRPTGDRGNDERGARNEDEESRALRPHAGPYSQARLGDRDDRVKPACRRPQKLPSRPGPLSTRP